MNKILKMYFIRTSYTYFTYYDAYKILLSIKFVMKFTQSNDYE